MCNVVKFEQSVSGSLWQPKTAVLTGYTQIQDSPFYTTESDNGDFYRGVYSATSDVVRRVSLNFTMDEDDMISLLQFREDVRATFFDMFLGRIDPFIDGNQDSTHHVRMLDFQRPTRNRRKQYSIQIGMVK